MRTFVLITALIVLAVPALAADTNGAAPAAGSNGAPAAASGNGAAPTASSNGTAPAASTNGTPAAGTNGAPPETEAGEAPPEADTYGLSAELWERVQAAESVATDLTPTPSPEAPPQLSLTQCIDLAYQQSADFRSDQEQLISAEQGLWVADQRFYSTLTSDASRELQPGGSTAANALASGVGTRWESALGGSLNLDVGTGTQDVFSDLFSQRPSVAVSYDQPVLRGFGLASSTAERLRRARTTLAAQELSFYDAHQELAQRVIQAYTSALLARGEVDIAQRAVDRAQKYYETNHVLFSGEGIDLPEGEKYISQVPELDVDQARLDWERAKQDLISRQQGYRDAVDSLLLAMGLAPGATPELTTVIPYTPQEYDEAALIQTALENSTALGRLSLSREDAQAARRLARSEWRPNLIASVGLTNLGETVGGTSLDSGWFTGVRLEVPMFDRQRQENVAGAERALSVLEQRTIASRDQVAQQVQRQVRAAVSSRARIDIGEQSVELAKKNREAAQEMQREGLTDSLRVLDAESRLVQAERSLLQEQMNYFLTTVEIRRAIGEDITDRLPE
jgi:outer membrane protein TolC